MNGHGASLNTLMKHMRDTAGIAISGSDQKRQLMLSGYYHGYKGYRYSRNPQNKIPYRTYAEIQSVIDFDEKIKASLYRPVMQLETALKSIVSEIIVKCAGSDSFSVIIEKLMHANGHKKQDDFIAKKYKMRDEVYSSLTKAYSRSNIVKHYYDKDTYVPIWAIFEVLTLGQFGTFVNLLDVNVKLEISKTLCLPIKYNTDGALLSTLIYMLRDLRNAIAHNSPIFDVRYRGNRGISQTVKHWLENETLIQNITFGYLADDIIFVFTLMKNLKFKKTQLYTSLKGIIAIDSELYKNIGAPLYMTVFTSETRKKYIGLSKYLHSN